MSERVHGFEGLDEGNYDRLLREATSERQELVIRLAGEAGLRPAEIARLEPGDVESRTRNGTTHYFLRLRDGESERVAYLPGDLRAALHAYVSTSGCSESEPIFGVSPRRIQMLVSDATDRAAVELDAPGLRSVSTRELRRFHARSLLERGINPLVVSEITTWNRLETLAESFPEPDAETIIASFDGTDRSGVAAGRSDDGAGAPTAMPDDVRRCVELVDHVVQLGATLSGASTREAIERGACETLAPSYEYVWIASETGNDELEIRELSVGPAADWLRESDAPPGTVCREVFDGGRPAVEPGTRLPVGGTGDPPTRVAVPIEHADTTYGVLEVGVRTEPERVADRERRILEDLGRRLGQAIAAVERRRLLLADTVVSLTFRCTDDRATFVRLSAEFDCSFTLAGLVPGEDGTLLAFVWLEGARPDDVFRRAVDTAAVESARLIRSAEDGSLLEFVLTTDSLVLTLVECGGSVTELSASGGRGTFTAEFVPDVHVRDVVESVERAFPESEMVAKREVERSVQTDPEFQQSLDDTLTDKQRSALRAAYLSGYFDWPRESTAEELAESLGISSPTFHNHLRRAQRKLLATFLDDGEP